jgi:nucleoside-diphosphate-sugar epimerase
MTDEESLRKGVEGVDVVVHCAAKVGDWGPVEDYREVNVEGLRRLLEAARKVPLKRFVHMSSLGVYEARDHYGTDESEPLPANHVDGYTQTKVESEQLAMSYYREHQLPLVVLRPGFIYGPRDRTVLPRIFHNLKEGKFRYLARGKKELNTIYVENLTEAIFLAIEKPNAVGQIYNLTDGEVISKRRFIEALVQGLNLPKPPRLSVPMWLAKPLARMMERKARKRGATEPPRLTQARLKFLGYNLGFSIEKAKRELGYRPVKSFDQGMTETIAWYRQQQEKAPV